MTEKQDRDCEALDRRPLQHNALHASLFAPGRSHKNHDKCRKWLDEVAVPGKRMK
ncbi:MAG: hypothetical protein HGA62_03785 [Chlorobiaceae bacterium]|nr:hypothetical protein [Chlorobiaceae bacterium]NTV59850.1 hypothetical protein [Chlorobiaceae bacterium]